MFDQKPPTIDVGTSSGAVAFRLIAANEGLTPALHAALGSLVDCSGYACGIAPPASPVKGRGHKRVEFNVAEGNAKKFFQILEGSGHAEMISVRQKVNRYGRIGHPKMAYID